MSLITGDRSRTCKYIYELPYTERKYLCNILDINDQWERLGGEKMGFTVLELNEIKRAEKCGESPTDRLLQHWGRKNNTILKLYSHLYSMEHFQAMNVLLPFIPEKYHYERLYEQIHRSEPARRCEPAEGAAAFPKPDPSLLLDLRPEMGIKNPQSASSSRTTQDRKCDGSSQQYSPNVNFCNNTESSRTNGRSDQSEQKVADCLLSSEAKQTVETQFPSVLQAELPVQTPTHAPPSVKILNTAAPPGAAKYTPSFSSNETNVETTNHNHKPLKEPLKVFNAKVRLEASLSEAGSDERERQGPTMQKGAPVAAGTSRKRYQSNCSEISTMSECGVPMIPYKELEDSTGFWHRAQLLGSGGFGSVYKGNWINVTVAVKRIKINGQKDGQNSNGSSHINQIMDELRFLQKYRHDNILQVYGFSADHGKPHCLVYQFMANGSLEYRLQCRKIESFSENVPLPLSWCQRFVIARGTAAALQFLHTVQEKPLIHGDVKSANILLDGYLEPKLGDFGLAREGPQSDFTSMKVSHVHGTRPYIPEEYLRSKKLSTKVDTYSFGIVLFEMCSGRRAYNEKTRRFLKEEVLEETDRQALRDPKAGSEGIQVFDILFDIGMECINRIPKKRPDMTTIFQDLENFRKILKEKDKFLRRPLSEDSQMVGSSMAPSPIPPVSLSTSPSSFLYPVPHHPHHYYAPSPPHYFHHGFPRSPAASPQSVFPSASPQSVFPSASPQSVFPSASPQSVLPSPNHPWRMGASPANSHHPPNPPLPENRSTSPPLDTPLPDFSRLLVNSTETPQVGPSSSTSDSISESFSTEGDLSLEMDDSVNSQPGASTQGPSPTGGSPGETLTEVCLPLLTQLGARPPPEPCDLVPEEAEDESVSATGKKSLFD